MKSLLTFVLITAIFLSVPFPSFAEAAPKEILIGLIPEMNVFKQQERFKPLTEYLSKKTGIKVNITILSRYGNILERFTAEKMDGAFFGSFTGALAIEKLGVEPIARPVNLDGSSTYHGYIFVRKDSGIKNVSDMKGKKMAFVEKATTAGYIFPVAYLRQHGVKEYKSFFKKFYFTGSHDASIYAVLDRKADIGASKHSIYDRVRNAEPRVDKELVVLAESVSVPSNGLCVRKGLDRDIKNNLRAVLLNLDRDPEGRVVLEKFGAIKFIDTSYEDYRIVSRLAKDAGIDIRTYIYRNE